MILYFYRDRYKSHYFMWEDSHYHFIFYENIAIIFL